MPAHHTIYSRIGSSLLGLSLLGGCAGHGVSRIDLDAAWEGVALPGAETSGQSSASRDVTTPIGTIPGGQIQSTRSLLPETVRDADGWSKDIMTAFQAHRIPPTRENLCAAIAVIAQESSFQAEPVVAGLPRIIQTELEKRRDQFHVPNAVFDAALAIKSPNGKTYGERIRALRTENDLNRLYDDMISELPLGKMLLGNKNPVKTGGPMQVSLVYAEQKMKASPYPYPNPGPLRSEVFSRRGGLYFGIGYLLDYPAPYDQMVYRFADYNAGHFASRNAGLQKTVADLSEQTLSLDGDLLRYEGEKPSRTPSETLDAILSIKDQIGVSETDIRDDLAREKTPDLETTATWKGLRDLASLKGKMPPRAHLPEIRLISPKITSGLTTAGFARKVNARYTQCLGRAKN